MFKAHQLQQRFFINYKRLYYSNATSCVTNNGFQSEFFPVKRGVRQGCPLSPYLFIICMELLTYQIRINKNIKGMTIAGYKLKNTCYADDASFILDGSKRSFETLIDILENLSFISGLKLNKKKMSSFMNRCYKRYKYSIPGKKQNFSGALIKPKLSGWSFPQIKNGI